MKSTKKYLAVYKESFSKDFPCVMKSRKCECYAFCITCRCDILVAHGGRADIVAHLNRKKHKDNVLCEEKNKKIDFSCNAKDDAVIHAECLFTSFLIEHNLALSCADHAGPLFRKMFPMSEVAKKYGCAWTKSTAIVNVIASDEEKVIVQTLKQGPFSIATDGSNDSDSKLYPIVVTFHNSDTLQIQSCLLSLPALEKDSTGYNIGNLLLDHLKSREIPLTNCLALSADNAPVMVGLKSGVAAVLKQDIDNLIIMGCPCHLINLAAEKGAACLPIRIDEILIDIYYYLEKSAKRKEKLKQFKQMHDTGVRKILKHVCTRWLSLGKCLARLLEQWQPLTSFYNGEIRGDKKQSTGSLESYQIPKLKDTSTLPSTHSSGKRKFQSPVIDEKKQKGFKKTDRPSCLSREERLFMFLSADINKAFCLFLLNVIPSFEKPNVVLQSQVPHVHVLRSILLDMFMDIISKFMKSRVVKSSASLIEVDYHNRVNQKDDADLVIGTSTSRVVDGLKPDEKKLFFSSTRKYFTAVCDYMVHKFPFKNDVLINAEVAQLSSIQDASFSSVKFFVNKFPVALNIGGNEKIDDVVDILQSQFCAFQFNGDLPASIKEEGRIDV